MTRRAAARLTNRGCRGTPATFHPHFLFASGKKKTVVEPSKEKTPPGGHRPPGETALNRPPQKPSTPYQNTGGVPIKPPNPQPRAAPLTHRANPEFDQLLFPRFPVVPKAWPPQTKRRWRLGRRSRCPKFFARYRSQNFDRCHSFLLASSAAGGARKRPRFAKRSPGTRGDHPPFGILFTPIFPPPSPPPPQSLRYAPAGRGG